MNDLVIKAASLAATKVPACNSQWMGDFIREFKNVNMCVAVQTDHGLMVPVVKNTNLKGLTEIAAEVKDLAGRARENNLKLDELSGGTFTISNLGMFGIKEFTAIINPPQCAIMAVGSGNIEIDPETGKPFTAMRATLSFDRRFIDENLANEFMSTFQRVVEQPQYMNLGLVPTMRRAMI